MARKSKYNAEYHLAWIEGLTRRGCTIPEIAEDIGVATSTLNKWIKDNEELSDAIKKARTLPDIKVENSLFRRATGTKVTKTRQIVVTSDSGESKPSRIEVLEEEIPPDTLACIFWLKNRNPKLWRDTQDISANVNDKIKLEPLTDAEIELFKKLNNEARKQTK